MRRRWQFVPGQAEPSITAADVVEDQSPLSEVAPGELGLDRLLAAEQPVHGGIEFVVAGVQDVEFLGEGGVVPVSGGGQLGAGEEESLGDQGRDEIAWPRGLGSDGGV